MEKKRFYEVPEILVFALCDILCDAEASTEIGGGYPNEWI